jgi:DNA-binding response OmpR family regulator
MAYDFSEIKVLIVEDNMPMAELLKSLLFAFGIGEVWLARNGREGFDLYNAHNPHLILTDWMMREIDGLTLIKMIRQNETETNQYVPIIMMTGFSEKRRVVQARDAGMTEFLVKPFTARDLYKRIEEIIERPRQFVKSDDFFGPDRRRRREPNYNGTPRRITDLDKSYENIILFKEDGKNAR